jgi:hypothetical protein
MSFNDLKIGELRNVAEQFGVDLNGAVGKNAIVEAIESEGVTFETYQGFLNAEKVEPEKLGYDTSAKKKFDDHKNGEDLVLVKMERENPTYDANGYRFTKAHPFIAMTEDEAQMIFDLETGFRLATPSEVKEYYG